MNFKELIRIINRLDQTEHNFDVYGEILVISYYIGIKFCGRPKELDEKRNKRYCRTD